jgi:hypothetical protein
MKANIGIPARILSEPANSQSGCLRGH